MPHEVSRDNEIHMIIMTRKIILLFSFICFAVMESYSQISATYQVDQDIPELNVSRNEYYTITFYDGGRRIQFENLTNSFEATGGLNMVSFRGRAHASGHYSIRNKHHGITLYGITANRVSDKLPDAVEINVDNRRYPEFKLVR